MLDVEHIKGFISSGNLCWSEVLKLEHKEFEKI